MESHLRFSLFLPGQTLDSNPVATGLKGAKSSRGPSSDYFLAVEAHSTFKTSLIVLTHRANSSDIPSLIKASAFAIDAFNKFEQQFLILSCNERKRSDLSKKYTVSKEVITNLVSQMRMKIVLYLDKNRDHYLNNTSAEFNSFDLRPHILKYRHFLLRTNAHLRREDGGFMTVLTGNFV